MKLTDTGFVPAFREGSDIAFRELHNYYYNSLCYFAGNLIYNKVEAEDIVADSLLKLWKVRQGFNAVAAMKSFLYVTTRNACIDYLRRKKKQDTSYREVSYLSSNDFQLLELEILSIEETRAIENTINKLPTQCGNIVKAIFFENMKTSEVARKLGISNQNVLNQKAKGIRVIKEALMRSAMLMLVLHCLGELNSLMVSNYL